MKHTRFEGDSTNRFRQLREAADAYPRALDGEQQLGFYQKPFDWHHGHPNFFNNMYQLLNGIAALQLAPESTIIEVGSGAGWCTEVLAALKYKVICLEPAEVMVDAAKQRVSAFLQLRRMPELIENVGYHTSTLEEADFLPKASADAMIFFESFHHIIDEHKALDEAYRILKPGGKLCILGDSNWIPGLREQEEFWRKEMATFGTLESPFTHEYLTDVLEQHGFRDIRRHHGVNSLVLVEEEERPVVAFAGHLNARYINLFIARRGAAGELPADRKARPAVDKPPVFVTAPEPMLKRIGIAAANAVPPLRPVLRLIWQLVWQRTDKQRS